MLRQRTSRATFSFATSSGIVREVIAIENRAPLFASYVSGSPLLSNLFLLRRRYATEKTGTTIKATWQKLPAAPMSDIKGVAVIDKKAYVLGSDLYTYDISTGQWSSKLKVKGSAFGQAVGGSAVVWSSTDILFELPKKRFTSPSINMLNITNLEVTGIGAAPLTAFKLAKTENPPRLWIMGESYQNTGNSADQLPCHIAYWERKNASDKKGEWFAQNLNSLTVTGSAPIEKKELHVTTVNNKLYVMSTSEDQTTIEVRTFDPQNFSWSLIDAKGTIPEPRIGSSISVLGNKIVLFGGHSQYLGLFRQHSNEVLCFDTDKNEWETVQAGGEQVKGRSGHQAINLGNNQLFFVGGKNELWKMSDCLKLTFHF